VEAFLNGLGQSWREDSSNRNLSFTRNRIRHKLLPLLEEWNPRLREHLAQMAELARDEEAWWQVELARLGPQILMAGKPVRGGGRASGDGLALDCTRLAALAPALQRRLLRYAAAQLGGALDFQSTEALRLLAIQGRAGQKLQLAQGLRAERTPREIRLTVEAISAASTAQEILEFTVRIPGEIVAQAFGIRLKIEAGVSVAAQGGATGQGKVATLRNWRPGDRVRLRYSGRPRKVKEVLERLRVTGTSRAVWPVLEAGGHIVWMKGVELEPEQGIEVVATDLDGASGVRGREAFGDGTFE
jgi:tRNA(Ile)-lysidine synthase